jgi:DNA (cytosine-5)-methyltransferase 1
VSFTLNTIDRPAVYDARGNGDGKTCPTITGDHENRITDYTAVCVSGDDVADTLDASYYKGCGERGFEERTVVADRAAVRRLTPLECERLQGYPDGWTDIGEWVDSRGKRHQTTDSARYKALGNSIALPYWRYLLKRISARFEYTPTMASLFDGIGGFPCLWEGINGKGTCLWASEIEEFPMAVTKLRIGE